MSFVETTTLSKRSAVNFVDKDTGKQYFTRTTDRFLFISTHSGSTSDCSVRKIKK